MTLTLTPIAEDEVPMDKAGGPARRGVLLDLLVEMVIDRITRETSDKTVTVMFDPSDLGTATLHSNASADLLARVLRQMAGRVEAGTLRMPVTGGARWVDETVQADP